MTEQFRIEEWNGIFMLYSLTSETLKLTLPQNSTIQSELPFSPQLSQNLSLIAKALQETDLHLFADKLRHINSTSHLQIAKIIANQLPQKMPSAEILLQHYLSSLEKVLRVVLHEEDTVSGLELHGIVGLYELISQAVGYFYLGLAEEVEVEHMRTWF